MSTDPFPVGTRRIAREEGAEDDGIYIWRGLGPGQQKTVEVTLNGQPIYNWLHANESTGRVTRATPDGGREIVEGVVRIRIGGWWE